MRSLQKPETGGILLNILKHLIRLHRFHFMAALLFTLLAILLNLCWNRFLAELLNLLQDASFRGRLPAVQELFGVFAPGIGILFLLMATEFLSSYLALSICEIFAHEMRMGYVRSYLHRDILTFCALSAGQEQSAMQNELRDVCDYLTGNLFPFIRQFTAFFLTATAEMTSAMRPVITDVETILLYDAADFMLENCDKSSRKLMNIHMKIHMRNALSDVGMHLFGIGGYLALLLTGFYFISHGMMAFSEVVYAFQVRGSVLAADEIAEMSPQERA